MRTRKYKVSEQAARQLARHRLTIGDVALVLRFGRKRMLGNVEQFFLGSCCVQQGCEQRFKRLLGTTIVIEGEEITNIYHGRLRETGKTEDEEQEKC